jgi:hypothetical protein
MADTEQVADVAEVSNVEETTEEKPVEETPDESTEEVTKEPTEEDTDSSEEDKETEEEDKEPEEESLESDNVYQTLKEKHPDVLKAMPELRRVIHRESQFSEIFPTPEDAKQAATAANNLETFEREIKAGRSEGFLKAISTGLGQNELRSFVSSIPETLIKQDRDAYFEMMNPEFKRMLQAAYEDKDPNISTAAKNIHWFLFKNADPNSEVGVRGKREDPKVAKFEQEKQEFLNKQRDTFFRDIVETTDRRLVNIIKEPLKNTGMSELVLSKLTDEIMKRVKDEMAKDTRHTSNMNGLFKQAEQDGFTSKGKDSLSSAFLSRARGLISKHRQTVLSEAKVSGKDKAVGNGQKPTRIAPGGQVDGKVTKIDPSKVDWNKTSDADFVKGNITYRK